MKNSLSTAHSWIPAFLGMTFIFLLAACAAFSPPKANMPSREGIVAGETITVERNQNVYAVARQHNVPMRDLIVLNDLQPPFNLHVGQKLVLPAGYRGESEQPSPAPMPPPSTAGVGAVEETSLPPVQTAPAAVVTHSETQYTNTPKAPPSSSKAAAETKAFTTPSPSKPSPTTATPSASQPQQLAAIAPSETAPPDAPQVAFIWPVQGPVLSGYGPKGQGLSNDGVNIGAPKSAPVVAAASGIVVYTGNEMKGFGNLVLIRHQGGWVTAYAHLDRVLVNKDAVVAQGDMIGTVGKTGNVGSPQLHFETRYQGKSVDPAGVVKAE